IDGTTVFEARREVTDDGWAGAGRPKEYRFAFTNAYQALEALGKRGDATTNHRIRMSVAGHTVGQDPIVFVYDTAEYPAGLVFNLEDQEARSKYTVIDLTEEL
ncbi:MAG: hypothetical protein M3245_05645, partial [Actinomycetota bacterium]|nr:hypothetical protein [Actinomycetota bacterium]